MTKKYSRIFFFGLVIVLAGLMIAGCASPAATEVATDAPEPTSPPEEAPTRTKFRRGCGSWWLAI